MYAHARLVFELVNGDHDDGGHDDDDSDLEHIRRKLGMSEQASAGCIEDIAGCIEDIAERIEDIEEHNSSTGNLDDDDDDGDRGVRDGSFSLQTIYRIFDKIIVFFLFLLFL